MYISLRILTGDLGKFLRGEKVMATTKAHDMALRKHGKTFFDVLVEPEEIMSIDGEDVTEGLVVGTFTIYWIKKVKKKEVQS